MEAKRQTSTSSLGPKDSPFAPILSWMQSKLNGTQKNKNQNLSSAPRYIPEGSLKEESSDWRHGLLAIGTFGSSEIKTDIEKHNLQRNFPCLDHLQDFTSEEVGELQKELNNLLHFKNDCTKSVSTVEPEPPGLGTDQFFTCSTNLEVSGKSNNSFSSDSGGKDGELQNDNGVVPCRGRDVYLDSANSTIGKRSISFLLKKIFVCKSGFAPAPSLRDPVSEARMEKILRAILQKKIYPQSSCPTSSTKKYLENRQISSVGKEEETYEKEDEGSKWVKTDSESVDFKL
ncbi:hypothetical protein RJ641_025828 [Dillenia turbinata]|uniref:Uncharacterized protein n=1 Tax=Dillenia turbinata TaxID=194707 RepID=A0AAN8WB88_9MAGN